MYASAVALAISAWTKKNGNAIAADVIARAIITALTSSLQSLSSSLLPPQFASPAYINFPFTNEAAATFAAAASSMTPTPLPSVPSTKASKSISSTKQSQPAAQTKDAASSSLSLTSKSGLFQSKQPRSSTHTSNELEPTTKKKKSRNDVNTTTTSISNTTNTVSSSSSATVTATSTVSSERKKRIFEVKQVPATFDPEAYALYVKYQRTIHKEVDKEHTEKGYTRFLCNAPFPATGWNGDTTYGAFHHHYRIDGKLIAVGVVDILPTCLSSVYLIYDTVMH
jgi:arginyl-tRNA--protein-N-Asp/Glu arginylyltransferase